MMITRIIPIITLIISVWIMIFVGSFVIFQLIVPLEDFYPGLEGRIITSIFKVGVSTILVIFWMILMWRIRNFFVVRRLLR